MPEKFEKKGCTPKRGRAATQRSEKVLDRVLGKGSEKGSEKAVCYGFYSSKKGSQKGFVQKGF